MKENRLITYQSAKMRSQLQKIELTRKEMSDM